MRFIPMKLKLLSIASTKMEVEPQIRMSYLSYLFNLDILLTMNNLKRPSRIQILIKMVLLISKNFLVGILQDSSHTMILNVICFFQVTLVSLFQKLSLLTKFLRLYLRTSLSILLKLEYKLIIPKMVSLYKLKLISQVQFMKNLLLKKTPSQLLKESNFLKTPIAIIISLVLSKLILL